jgi:hypothetical protein
MNRDVARGQDIEKRGWGFENGAEVGTTCGSGADSVCVFYVSVLFVFILCLVYSMLSVHSVTRSFN